MSLLVFIFDTLRFSRRIKISDAIEYKIPESIFAPVLKVVVGTKSNWVFPSKIGVEFEYFRSEFEILFE